MVTLLTSSGKPVLLDSEDYDILTSNSEQPMSEAQNVAKLQLSVSSDGYVVLNVGQHKRVTLSRLILGIVDQPSLIVKYRNNNKLDLRRENLKVSTRREHCREEVLPYAPEVKKVQGVHKIDSKTWAVEDGYGKGGILKYKKFCSFEEAKRFVEERSFSLQIVI